MTKNRFLLNLLNPITKCLKRKKMDRRQIVYEDIHKPYTNYLVLSYKRVFGNSKLSQRSSVTKNFLNGNPLKEVSDLYGLFTLFTENK